jgi:hypothetical protein
MYLGGLDGWIDDEIALVHPCGFDMDGITLPVSIWFGSRDTYVPRAHAGWLLAHIPTAHEHEYPGGHEPGDTDSLRLLAWLAPAPA